MYDVFIQNGNDKIQINGQRTSNRVIGKTTQEENKIPSFTFEIYPNNEGFYKIEEFITVVLVKDGTKTVFDGRVLTSIPSIDSQGLMKKSVTCEGILGYLNDSFVYPYKFKDLTSQLKYMIEFHNSQVETYKQFEIENVRIPIFLLENLSFTTDDTTWTALTKDEFTNSAIHLRYAAERREGKKILLKLFKTETDSNTEIALNVNASSLTITPNYDNFCTRVIPITKDGIEMDKISISQNNYYVEDEAAVRKYGVICKTVRFEEITNPLSLKEAAKNYLANNQAKKISVAVTAYDLFEMGLASECFEIGKKYWIHCKELRYSEKHKLIKITRDINDTWNTTLEFGNNMQSIKTMVAKNKNKSYLNVQEGD